MSVNIPEGIVFISLLNLRENTTEKVQVSSSWYKRYNGGIYSEWFSRCSRWLIRAKADMLGIPSQVLYLHNLNFSVFMLFSL